MAELTQNTNFFQPTGFKLIIERTNFPNLEFFAQSISHPSVDTNAAEVPFQIVNTVPYTSDKLQYGALTVNIILDEDFNAYTEIHNWMVRNVTTKENRKRSALNDGTLSSYNDITVIALTSHNNANKRFKYNDCVPVSLGDINFEATNSSVEFITIPVTFRFSYFDIE